ncbi:hypothetical protein L0F63_006576, partial [Massospora cicadina]
LLDSRFVGFLAGDTQDSFSITSASPELTPTDVLDEEFARLYASNSASELAAAAVAAMQIDATELELADAHPHPVEGQPVPSEFESQPHPRSENPNSPRSAGVHPLSRETTSVSHRNKHTPIPALQASTETARKGPTQPSVATAKAHPPQADSHQQPSTSTPGLLTKNLGAQDWTTLQILADDKSGHFRDRHGRYLFLRGVNVAGCSKIPKLGTKGVQYPDADFYDHRHVDFVGRPFQLEEAPEHFQRLRLWGLTVLRVLVPWEALEHEGPGLYDHRYIAYLRQLLTLAQGYGFKVVIDPHQDVWSRFSGGSGAPGWTFEVAGMDLTQFDETGAAHLQGMPLLHPSHVPLWMTNQTKLAAATMLTLFFGGNTFAPGRQYEGVSVQDFLQGHYISCYRHLARQLKGLACVLGFEVINEPHPGYIGVQRIDRFDESRELHLGLMPSPLQSMALGDGLAQRVKYYNKSWPWPSRAAGVCDVNPRGARAWLAFTSCVWREQGVWGVHPTTGAPVALKLHHFSKTAAGAPVDFNQDFYLPFVRRFAAAIREAEPELIVFLAPIPNQPPPKLRAGELGAVVYAPHWYDLRSVFTKSFDGRVTYDVLALTRGSRNLFAHTYFGAGGTRRCYSKQIRTVRGWGQRLGTAPTWVGEVGIPFDINGRQAYATQDYALHERFMDAVLNAVEENFASFALWNYNPLNSHVAGDGWNLEDFSIYCKDHVATPDPTKEANPLHCGGRCLGAVARPYAAKVAGRPLHTSFDLATLEFHLEFASTPPNPGAISTDDVRIHRQTEIFLPSFHYKRQKLLVHLSDGAWKYVPELQTLYHWFADARKVEPVAPTTDYEDDGMLLSEDEGAGRLEFEVHQLEDSDGSEHDASRLPPGAMVHKIRILVQDHVPEQEGCPSPPQNRAGLGASVA